MGDFSYNSTGVDLSRRGGGPVIPEGLHSFRIVEAKPATSKKGYPMAEIVCEVMNNPDLVGRRLKHWVVFMPPEHKAAGMAIHFLKVIGQPWEGQFDITVSAWEGATFIGKIKHEPFISKKTGNEVTGAKIASVDYIGEPTKTEDIPF